MQSNVLKRGSEQTLTGYELPGLLRLCTTTGLEGSSGQICAMFQRLMGDTGLDALHVAPALAVERR